MAVFRVEKNDNYTAMSNYHLKDKHLSLKAKGLLSFMLSLPDDWDYSVNGLVAVCKEEERAIKSTLKELESRNYLKINKITPQKGNNKFSYEYVIYELPQNEEVQNVGLQDVGVQVVAVQNAGQINTNKQSTNKQNITTTPIKENLVDFVEENFGRTLAPIEYEEIQNWEDNELTRYAIKQAVLNAKYSIKYISKILYEYEKGNIKTVQQAQQREEEYASKRKSQNKKPYQHETKYQRMLRESEEYDKMEASKNE